MKRLLLLASLCLVASPAMASGLFAGTDDRADAVVEQVKGNNDYHAFLAIQFANIAVDEKDHFDAPAAKYFIERAEAAAAKSGSAK